MSRRYASCMPIWDSKYGIDEPRILVTGLNPHAGEGGYLGREEIEVITPVLERLRAEGMTLIGPLPADTLFTPPILSQGDCVLAMYHDQGLPVLKYASFGQGINVTLGLPIIRTSVDHGTALELAGSGRADPGSLFRRCRAGHRDGTPGGVAEPWSDGHDELMSKHVARKRFGQNFLIDQQVIADIVNAVAPQRARLCRRDRPGARRADRSAAEAGSIICM